MERRVLIVEAQNDFALSMASVLRNAGFQTAMAPSAAEASRELGMRRCDLVVLRAELPDSSGFVLCGEIKKGKFGQPPPVLLLSSVMNQEGFEQHARRPDRADGYLAVPFQVNQLAELVVGLVPSPNGADEMDSSLDSALGINGHDPVHTAVTNPGMPVVPPPIRTTPGGPPKLPRKERRSAITEEDRAFLERAFSSIADRKAELLAESRQSKRPPPRREMLGTPEGKLQIIRDELKGREAQIARLSEIWSVRERELLSVEDRVHDKDVELQGLKDQINDWITRHNGLQQEMARKEREHGASLEEMYFQKAIGEKDLIEVVSHHSKEIHLLKKELGNRDEELARRAVELDEQRNELHKLEKEFGTATLEFEVKEKSLADSVAAKEARIVELDVDLAKVRDDLAQTLTERDGRYAKFEADFLQKSAELDAAKAERESTVRDLEGKLSAQTQRAELAEEEISRLQKERADFETKTTAHIDELSAELDEARARGEDLRVQRDGIAQTMTERLAERDAKISVLESELSEARTRAEKTEDDLNAQVAGHLEKIGELEGEVEASKAHLADREEELASELAALHDAKDALEQDLTTRLSHADGTIQTLNNKVSDLEADVASRHENIRTLEGHIAARDQKVAELNETLASTQKTLESTGFKLSQTEATLAQTSGELEATQGELTSTRAMLEETQGTLSSTQTELSRTIGVRDTLDAELGKTRVQLEEVRAELQKTVQERTQREGEVQQARNEIQRLTGILRQTEAAKAKLEEELMGQIGQLRAELSEASGNYEAEKAAHERLQLETNDQIGSLGAERDDLRERLEATSVDLAATKANLDDLRSAHAREQKAHAEVRAQLQATTAELTGQLEASKDHALDLGEQLSAMKQELGARVAEVTQLTAQVAHGEDARAHLEERTQTITEEAQRREEILQNDLAGLTKEKTELERKVATALADKQRVSDQAGREAIAKNEQIKQLDQKVKLLADEAKKKADELTQKLSGANQTLESTRAELAERSKELQQSQKAWTTAQHERDTLKATLSQQIQQLQAREKELASQIVHEKAEAKRAHDEVAAKLARTEARIAQISQESVTRIAELDQKVKESGAQLTARAKKIQELELAVENAHGAKLRAEKDSAQKTQASEAKANEALQKLQTALRERKELEARLQKDLEDGRVKHKEDLDRRDVLKTQEVTRLQTSLQEKSKALKVAELELQRYKNKPAAAGARTAPAASALKSAAAALDDVEPHTAINTLPTEAVKSAREATQSRAAAPSTSSNPARMTIPVSTARTEGTPPRAPAPGVTAPKPAAAVQRTASITAPPVAKKPAPQTADEDSGERTMVMAVPKGPGEEDDWTALVDDLDK